MKQLTKTVLGGILACIVLSIPQVFASNYPNRPVRFVVPWPPGDLEDILTRIIAEEMSKETGKPATVVNRPGGGAVIGASDVARAQPDGLTIGSFVNDLLTLKVMSKTVPWDESTFEPVGIFLDYPFVMATRADAPYSSMAELADYSQTNSVSLGHFGYQPDLQQ